MNKILKPFLLLTAVICFSFSPSPMSPATDFCGIKNTAFKNGEVVTMNVFYKLVGYVSAGEATFTTTLERFNGKTVYHCVGEGKTYSFFDNFFKVRDRMKVILILQPCCL